MYYNDKVSSSTYNTKMSSIDSSISSLNNMAIAKYDLGGISGNQTKTVTVNNGAFTIVSTNRSNWGGCAYIVICSWTDVYKVVTLHEGHCSCTFASGGSGGSLKITFTNTNTSSSANLWLCVRTLII